MAVLTAGGTKVAPAPPTRERADVFGRSGEGLRATADAEVVVGVGESGDRDGAAGGLIAVSAPLLLAHNATGTMTASRPPW